MWFNNLHFTVMVVIKITIVEVAINPQVFTATTADWVSLVALHRLYRLLLCKTSQCVKSVQLLCCSNVFYIRRKFAVSIN